MNCFLLLRSKGTWHLNNSGKKLVVGTQLGILSLWAPSRGLLDHVDRFPGHPSSVDAICMLDDDTVLTGSSDGLIRVVQLFPHQLLGVVGDHDGMPVECMRLKGRLVVSLGHGSECKLTDLTPLLDGDDEDDEAEELQASDAEHAAAPVEPNESESDSDSPPPQPKRRAKGVASVASAESAPTEDDPSSFFADL